MTSTPPGQVRTAIAELSRLDARILVAGTIHDLGDLATDPDLVAEIDLAVKAANQAVSKAEAIRKFRILPVDFTEDTGELTPTLKVKRKVVAQKFASDIDALYQKD